LEAENTGLNTFFRYNVSCEQSGNFSYITGKDIWGTSYYVYGYVTYRVRDRGWHTAFKPVNMMLVGETLSNSKTDLVQLEIREAVSGQLNYSCPLSPSQYYPIKRNGLIVFDQTTPCTSMLYVRLNVTD
jgi:hypothetical protein